MFLEKQFFDSFEDMNDEEWDDAILFRTHLNYDLFDSGWRTSRENDKRILKDHNGNIVKSWYSPSSGGMFETKSDAMNFLVDSNISEYFFILPVISIKVSSIKEVLNQRSSGQLS